MCRNVEKVMNMYSEKLAKRRKELIKKEKEIEILREKLKITQ